MIIGVTAVAILSFLFGKIVLTLLPVVIEDFLFKMYSTINFCIMYWKALLS